MARVLMAMNNDSEANREVCSVCQVVPAASDGRCRRCRMRELGAANRRYTFTEFIDSELRRAYGVRSAERGRIFNRLARQTGWPRHVFYQRAGQLGFALSKRPWTEAEDELLAEVTGSLTVQQIASKLRRTPDAIKCRMSHLQLLQRVRREGYNMTTLAEVFGVSETRIRTWMGRGWFGPVKQIGGAHRVSSESVMRFIKQHSDAYDLRAVDQGWLKSMLFGDMALVRVD